MPRPRKHDTLQDLDLQDIRPSLTNARKTVDPAAIAALAESIKQVGVLQPITVRPNTYGGEKYEIVFGERRYLACKLIAEQKKNAGEPVNGYCSIRSIIRDMGDDEVIVAGIIENLQREDVTEEEEAAAFADFAARYQGDAISVLAEKTGANPRYIRKRIAVMRLPRPCIIAWKRGIITYSHLEQLLRLPNKGEVLEIMKEVFSRVAGEQMRMTVKELKEAIDKTAIAIECALFDATECKSCAKNCATQLTLFGVGGPEAKCQDQRCFLAKQTAWLLKNWKTFEGNKAKTNSFVFNFDREASITYFRYGTPIPDKCASCESFASQINIMGESRSSFYDTLCNGPSECYPDILRSLYGVQSGSGAGQQSMQKAEQTKQEKRSENHGELFRQEFYARQIPKQLAQVESPQVHLWALCHSNNDVRLWFIQRYAPEKDPDELLITGDFLGFLEATFSKSEVEGIIKQALAHIIFTGAFDDLCRRRIADYVGVDLAYWTVTESWLQKKTKGEIIQFIADHKLMNDQSFLLWLRKKFNRTEFEVLATLKKSQIVEAILQSGADLTGKVPSEITNLCTLSNWPEERILNCRAIAGDPSAEDPEDGLEDEPEDAKDE